ncbi:MAG: hypothetical protein HYV26_02040 [Candidatus Hydrogenedentes bacterium]|nr:hypothetical protein [Candidatus Hydrogenedentota bacterium]
MKSYAVTAVWLALMQSMFLGSAEEQCSVAIKDAELIEFPGVVETGRDPQSAGVVDCNSPAHWAGDTMYLFNSAAHPFRSSGPDVFHLSRPATRVTFDNEATWTMGARWIEATHQADDEVLYMWYHNEPPVIPSKTAPRIGSMISKDNGLTWRDLGIVLEAPVDSNNLESVNFYFVGGNGDFCVVADQTHEYFYFFISTYNKVMREQGVSVARMAYNDRDNPSGKILKWHEGEWKEPGVGGQVSPIFPAAGDWHSEGVDAFWGPSVHFNTHLNQWVMLLNRAKDKNWAQEGIYISFNEDLSKPVEWTKPTKILDASQLKKSKWYPQVIGLGKQETDKLAGKTARLFVAGLSKWEIAFLRSGEEKRQGQ